MNQGIQPLPAPSFGGFPPHARRAPCNPFQVAWPSIALASAFAISDCRRKSLSKPGWQRVAGLFLALVSQGFRDSQGCLRKDPEALTVSCKRLSGLATGTTRGVACAGSNWCLEESYRESYLLPRVSGAWPFRALQRSMDFGPSALGRSHRGGGGGGGGCGVVNSAIVDPTWRALDFSTRHKATPKPQSATRSLQTGPTQVIFV